MARKRISENDLVVSASAAAPARRKAAAKPRTAHAAPQTETPDSAPVIDEPQAAADVIGRLSYDDVARLAYSYWAGRGFQGGSPEEDWLRAEQELRVQSAVAVA